MLNKKHILILVPSLTCGGAEKVTVNLCSHLVEKGYMVTLVTLCGEERDFFTLDSRIMRICLESVKRDYIPVKLPHTLKRILSLRWLIKHQKPDIILGMMIHCAVIAILASQGLPVKVITSERNFPGRRKVVMRWSMLRKLCYRFADGHVAQTCKISDWLKKHTNASNITIIPNAVSCPITALSPLLLPEEVIKKEEQLILAVGRLHEQKGFDLLISAFHRIVPMAPGWVLVILGKDAVDENQRLSLQKQIDELNMNDRIKIPGCAGNIADWYHRSDIFVLSSRYEGFPNVLLEAMAYGRACISFDCDTGPSEIIINEENGLLVTPEDVDALAASIKRLIQDKKLRTDMAIKATEVRERFSEQRIMNLWPKFFEEVMTHEGH